MKIKVFTLNVFAKSKGGCNPAGVVLDADDLSDEQMQRVANKVGFSETAFVQKSNKADFKVKFFTPTAEVELCGHATVATFYLLAEKQIIRAGKYSQETGAGILAIEVLPDKTVFMDQALPKFSDTIDKSSVAEALNISPDYFINDLPVQIVSTGGVDIFVPVDELKKLLSLKPDFQKLIAISKKYNVEGFCVFTQETKFNSTAHYRSFAPAVGILEDPACGVQAGALACYLFRYKKISAAGSDKLVFEQGYSVNKPSEIKTKLEIDGGDITRICVGGAASDIEEIGVEI